MPKSKDLFDDTTMTFGEHLEVLRVHLWKAIIGLAIAVIFMLIFGNHVVNIVRKPIDDALKRHSRGESVVDDVEGFDPIGSFKQILGFDKKEEEEPKKPEEQFSDTIAVTIDAKELATLLRASNPDSGVDPDKIESKELTLNLRAPEFTAFKKTCLLYTSPSPRDRQKSRMPSSA